MDEGTSSPQSLRIPAYSSERERFYQRTGDRAGRCTELSISERLSDNREEQLLTLDYPNKEVLNSLASMYLKLSEGNMPEIVMLYNIAIAEIPYEDYAKNRNEYWYHSMFMMLLRGVGIVYYAEIHMHKGAQ